MHAPDSGLLIEAKYDFVSEKTGNLCIELEALRHSKAPLFVYGLPDVGKTRLHAFHVWELERLANQQKLTPQGRFYAFKHIYAGDQAKNECVLLPKEILKTVGRPFEKAIQQLTKQAA